MHKGIKMKSFYIALKDFTRSYRSAFALTFMFAIPLLVTGMFYFMFGNLKSSNSNMTPTNVVLVNLDKGDPQAGQLGNQLVSALQDERLSKIMKVTLVTDETSAKHQVDIQQAGVAVIIPADFSASFSNTDATARIALYQDPTLTIGPEIVRSILGQIVDQFSGVKITLAEAMKQVQAGELSNTQIAAVIKQYAANVQLNGSTDSIIELHSLASAKPKSPLEALIGPVMAGMMIFFTFFTGVNTANSILREAEEGTLPRLFSTPTNQVEVLRGKFMSVGLTVLVQVIILIIATRLIFGITWGSLPVLILAAIALVCSATTFGIMLSSFLKNTKQGGIIFSSVLTVTGMLGMINIFTGNPQGSPLGIAPLFTPQGWVVQAMLGTMNGLPFNEIYPFILVSLAISIVFFVIGVWRFQRRYA
jgi:ABC-2 type transport system permease protein